MRYDISPCIFGRIVLEMNTNFQANIYCCSETSTQKKNECERECQRGTKKKKEKRNQNELQTNKQQQHKSEYKVKQKPKEIHVSNPKLYT